MLVKKKCIIIIEGQKLHTCSHGVRIPSLETEILRGEVLPANVGLLIHNFGKYSFFLGYLESSK